MAGGTRNGNGNAGGGGPPAKRELIDAIDRTPEYEAFLASLQAFYDRQQK